MANGLTPEAAHNAVAALVEMYAGAMTNLKQQLTLSEAQRKAGAERIAQLEKELEATKQGLKEANEEANALKLQTVYLECELAKARGLVST